MPLNLDARQIIGRLKGDGVPPTRAFQELAKRDWDAVFSPGSSKRDDYYKLLKAFFFHYSEVDTHAGGMGAGGMGDEDDEEGFEAVADEPEWYDVV